MVAGEVAGDLGVDVAAIRDNCCPSRERKVACARRARQEAGTTFDALPRRTGRTQASVWQTVGLAKGG